MALELADRIISDGKISAMREERYRSFTTGRGLAFANGELTLEELKDIGSAVGEPEKRSGKQEQIRNMINQYLFG